MIIFKGKSGLMLDRISQKLEQAGLEDFEIVSEIPEDNVGISGDLSDTEVFLPESYDYLQYDLADFIRTLAVGLKTTTTVDRDLIRLKIRGRLTEPQYFKLIKYIIEETDFCSIIN